MEANQNHPKPAFRTSRLLRLLGVSFIGLIVAAGSASAQLGTITGAVGAAPDLGQATGTVTSTVEMLPIPVVEQTVATPLGYASIYASQQRAAVCHDLYSALPLPIMAAAAASGCIELDAKAFNATLAQNIAGQRMQVDAGAELPSLEDGHVGAWAQVHGFFDAAIDAAVDLF